MTFDEAFSDEAIIRELCRARLKLTQERRQVLFFHNICADSKNPRDIVPKNWRSIPTDIFPPRRQWHRFRRRHRQSRPSEQLNLEALQRAIHHYRAKSPTTPWVLRLNKAIEKIRTRVFSDQPVEFQRPEISLQVKDQSARTFRALAVFTLEDKVIDCLTARYLRHELDPALMPSCLAFRACNPMPSIHTALEAILDARQEWNDGEIYVAECDIKGFFDCVSHSVAERALNELIEDARKKNPGVTIVPQARRIFSAYLNAYSFESTVFESDAYRQISDAKPPGTVKWYPQDLKKLHDLDTLPHIGVPQGGSLSCLVANAVLHAADKALEMERPRRQFLYLRYCDDMILLSPHKGDCEAVFRTYQNVLRRLMLLVHAPELVRPYISPDAKRTFWQRKSKAPFLWAYPPGRDGVPWIQFVGYQIRRDGLVRIRLSSLKKERQKIVKIANDLLTTVGNAKKRRKIVRRSRSEILRRLRQRLISMAVGRARLGEPVDRTLPMCWANGFRGLLSVKAVINGIKALDRCREHQLKRVERGLKRLHVRKQSASARQKVHRYYGAPFSYCRRFLK